HGVDHVAFDVRANHVVEGDTVGVLGGDHHGLDGGGAAVGVDHRGLGLAVGADVVQRPVLAHLGQAFGQAVREVDGQRNHRRGLVTGVAEHQALVAGALVAAGVGVVFDARLVGGVDSLRDVRGLGADGHRHAAGGAIEAHRGGGVDDVEDA